MGGWVTGERSRTAHGPGFRVWPVERDLCGKGDGSVGHIVTDQQIDRHQKRHLNVTLVLQGATALPRNISVTASLLPVADHLGTYRTFHSLASYSTRVLADFDGKVGRQSSALKPGYPGYLSPFVPFTHPSTSEGIARANAVEFIVYIPRAVRRPA